MEKFSKAMDWIYRVVLFISSLCVIGMALIITYQVFMRFTFSKTPRWSEEFTISILMLYAGFLGATVAYRHRMHIGIKVLLMKLPGKVRAWFYFAIDILVGLFSLSMIFYGSRLAWGFRAQILPATGISVGLSYLPIPVAGLIFLLFVIEKLLSDFTNKGKDDAFLAAVGATED
jgi:TRAP-type transport system small permease protein